MQSVLKPSLFSRFGRLLLGGLRWLWRYGALLMLYALFIVFLLPRSMILTSDQWYRIAYLTSAYQFDYIGWEINALRAKFNQTLYGQHPFIDEAQQVALVRAYMADVQQVRRLEAQINQIYADPAVNDAALVSADLRAERDALRQSLRERQMTIEAILEGQVAMVLVEEGFGTAGQLLPPMAMHFSRVPNLLVTSPRDQIRMDTSINLVPMPIDEIEHLEAQIDEQFDVASLVVPIGGIALYPAMIYEATSLTWIVETFAHEWLHHYLFFYPLGVTYFTDMQGFAGDARTINETTADLFGREIGRKVIERYYPDLLPPPPPVINANEDTNDDDEAISTPPPDPEAFDFGRAMHETRLRVDALLAAGEVEAAEAYMEERRQVFYENGYVIRKLNQAYFAFYGGYQGGGGPGAAGSDPVGPAVQYIRQNSPSALAFVLTMRSITTREALLHTATMMGYVPAD